MNTDPAAYDTPAERQEHALRARLRDLRAVAASPEWGAVVAFLTHRARRLVRALVEAPDLGACAEARGALRVLLDLGAELDLEALRIEGGLVSLEQNRRAIESVAADQKMEDARISRAFA